ncbi:MAG: hypothetical protein OXP12_09745 [Thaumarchaeota archaeon]|nr:hypothetical protein [Nitrososphaerota archaeon]MDE0525066.1 hypothetical protein [Nitrososphaerota archaeon]
MGSRTVRKVGKKEYLYYSYYDSGRKVSKYCGHVTDTESERRADAYEIEDLESQILSIHARLKELRDRSCA